MKKLLTLDVGTTAVKVGLFTENLDPLMFVINEYQLITPKSDIVEMDPQTYWLNAVKGIREVLDKTETAPDEVAAITCTTQGETLIPVGADKKPLCNAIVWLDSRAVKEAEVISKSYDPTAFYLKTGLPEVNAYCPIAKLLWLKNNLPDTYEKAEKILLLEDYLILRLSGKYATNPALMCSTGYFDIIENRIWDGILNEFSIDTDKIPPVYPCATAVGTLLPHVAEQLGLCADTIITTGAMDQVASAIGSGNTRDGIVQDSTGTCLAVAATAASPNVDTWSPVTVYSHAVPGKYLKIMISQTAGIALKWFRNEFCKDIMDEYGDAAFKHMDELAASVPALSRGLSLFPFLTGMQAPVLDEQARGVFFGIGLDTGRDCFIRAIMESVGYMLLESIELMRLNPDRIISLGGGSKSDIWCQIKADILNTQIAVMEAEESASLGAAILGGLGCGIFGDMQAAASLITQRKTYTPQAQSSGLYERGYAHYKRLYEQFKPLFGKL